jgi:radical SAM superfamily enzyme YgiQ (UPF0313 family)
MSTPKVLLISCYELGHQPLELAWPLAALRQAGVEAAALDLAVQPFDGPAARAASFVGIATPMQTALRLGVQAAGRVRAANPDAHICFFGLYAWLNRDYLLAHGADSVIGGEVEAPLVCLARAVLAGDDIDGLPGVTALAAESQPNLERPTFPVPHRKRLPSLEAYARYVGGEAPQLVGYTEATKGCQHLCRHCPIVPVYQGRMFVVPVETVLADVRQQVAAGARHIVFGDADFLNGPAHSLRIARALHAEHPRVTFDFTAKVEHILAYRQHFSEFAALGCTFMTTAVESLSDRVLARLDKGHTGADVAAALDILDQAGIAVQATLVAFTPWTTLDDYLAVVDFIQARGLQENFRPVQMSVRLLVPPHSALAEAPDAGEWLGELDAANFSYRWQHADPRMDELHAAVVALVFDAEARGEQAHATHARIRALAYAAAGQEQPAAIPIPAPGPRNVPRLTEDWFCCAEPTRGQVDLIHL